MAVRCALALVFAAGLGACDRRLEPWVPLDQVPPPVDVPVRIPGLEQPKPRSSMAVTAGSAIQGVVRTAEGAVPARGGVLFVIARPEAGGPPLAVRRLPGGPFPMAFELGPGDAMIPGRPLAGSVRLTARLDADGDPLSRQEGDLVAEEMRVAVGSSGIELVLR